MMTLSQTPSRPFAQPHISVHAEARLQQRGYTHDDLHLIRTYGEAVKDGYLMTDKAVQLVERDFRRILQRLERLHGTTVIEQEGNVVTIYRASKPTLRKLKTSSRRKSK